MALLIWPEPMDPYDIVDYTIDVTALLEGDTITQYSVTPLPESTEAGLRIGINQYSPSISENVIRIWLSIDPTKQTGFSKGRVLPLEVSVTTSSTPPRKRQRTVGVRVLQR